VEFFKADEQIGYEKYGHGNIESAHRVSFSAIHLREPIPA
jgi:hypothetical protein